MKKIIEKLSLLKIITVILVVAILFSVISFLPQLQLKRSNIETIVQEGIQKGEMEPIDKSIDGNVFVAESNGKKLYVNPSTLNITVVDDATDTVWTSIPQSGTLEDEDKAPMLVSFLDATGAVNNWDVYTQCIKLDNTTRELEVGEEPADTYQIYQLPDGFRANLRITKAEVTDLNQYMPKKISIARYNECFIDKIKAFQNEAIETIKSITGVELKADENGHVAANIDAEKLEGLSKEELKKVENAQDTLENATKYLKALDMIYDIDAETEDHYYNKYAGTPPLTVTNILIDLSKKALYTRDDLINDSREFDVTDVEFAQPADFNIVMDVKLVDGDLVVHIPTYEIQNNSEDPDYYTLHSISVFPNFGIVNADKYDDGFIFVPDGSGALFDINSYDSGYAEYERPVYNNTYFDTLYTDSEYNEDLMLPVFGMGKNGQTLVAQPEEEANDGEENSETSEEPTEETTEIEVPDKSQPVKIDLEDKKGTGVYTGFMGIIESGAETAAITVKLGSKAQDASSLNKVYPTFDVMQYSNVKVFGPYSTNDAKFLAKTDAFGMDIKVRYKLYTKDCNYFTMASDYKEYLIKTNEGVKEEFDVKNPAPEVFLDVISALSVEDRIMGVPYDHVVSMTTYSELNDILNDLGDVNTVVSYKGAYNGGIYNKINQKAVKTSANGSEDEYKALMEQHGDSIYMSTPISYVYKDNSVFNPDRHALLGFDSEPVKVYDYDIPSGRFNLHGEGHWILSPYYLPGVVSAFTKSLEANTNLAIEDLGNLVYAHNKSEEEVNLYEGEIVIKKALDTLSEGDRKLVLTNPFATRMLYATYATDISRESSDYGLIRYNVPFRQLVMNGLTNYTTLTINESSSSTDYYILQAVELGSSPKFKITSKSVDDLKEGNYHELFSTEYALIADEIKNVSKEINDAFAQIGTNEIVGHTILDNKVFETTYATGVKVISNYNKLDVSTEYGDIPAESYIIIAAENGNDEAADIMEGGEVDG